MRYLMIGSLSGTTGLYLSELPHMEAEIGEIKDHSSLLPMKLVHSYEITDHSSPSVKQLRIRALKQKAISEVISDLETASSHFIYDGPSAFCRSIARQPAHWPIDISHQH